MSAPPHPHGRLFALHGGGQAGEDRTSPSFPFHVERAVGGVLPAAEEGRGDGRTHQQRLQAGVEEATPIGNVYHIS